jgi:hypothetical protein
MIFGHTHDYEAVAVEHSATGPFSPTGTAILWRCKCAHVFSERIEGKWTLGQVRGERELTEAERIEFEAELGEAAERLS